MRVRKALFHLVQFGYSEGCCSTCHSLKRLRLYKSDVKKCVAHDDAARVDATYDGAARVDAACSSVYVIPK